MKSEKRKRRDKYNLDYSTYLHILDKISVQNTNLLQIRLQYKEAIVT